MDYPAIEKLYQVIGQNTDTYDTALTVRSMMDDLKEFLAERTRRQHEQKARAVFSHVDVYKDPEEGIFAVFSGYMINDFNFTIDVQVLEREYKLMFFERSGKLSGQNDPIKPIVNALGWANDVKYLEEINRYAKSFPIPGGESSLDQHLDKVFDHLISAEKIKQDELGVAALTN